MKVESRRSDRDGREGDDVLVLNSGSSSVKYQLFRFAAACTADSPAGGFESRPLVLCAGRIEGVGERGVCRWTSRLRDEPQRSDALPASDHAAVLAAIRGQLEAHALRVDVCGHRVVHGGARFSAPALVDDAAVAHIRECAALAPLHNPANAAGIELSRSAFPAAAQVAVFDTAFHTATMDEAAWRFPLPRSLAVELGARRYGFHGTSHAYVHRRASRFLGKERLTCVTLHLSNGCSLAAIESGKVLDTSMGMTPLGGVAMGTRSGDLPPSVPLLLCARAGLSPAEAEELLNTRSGLQGLCGCSDVREIERLAAEGAARPEGAAEEARAAELALRIYAHRIRHCLGGYWLQLGGQLDALAFTAGVG